LEVLTCASLAISHGANIKIVQKLLGHESAALTLDRFRHLFPDDLYAGADAFDAAADDPSRETRLAP
jgi:site-specific recombinase XerD